MPRRDVRTLSTYPLSTSPSLRYVCCPARNSTPIALRSERLRSRCTTKPSTGPPSSLITTPRAPRRSRSILVTHRCPFQAHAAQATLFVTTHVHNPLHFFAVIPCRPNLVRIVMYVPDHSYSNRGACAFVSAAV